jgi:hypothetical protein
MSNAVTVKLAAAPILPAQDWPEIRESATMTLHAPARASSPCVSRLLRSGSDYSQLKRGYEKNCGQERIAAIFDNDR